MHFSLPSGSAVCQSSFFNPLNAEANSFRRCCSFAAFSSPCRPLRHYGFSVNPLPYLAIHEHGQPYDGVKVDVFSVGCMGFMMFTGIPPFDFASRNDPKFRRVVYQGDLQGYLAEYGMPSLPDPVRVRRRFGYTMVDKTCMCEII